MASVTHETSLITNVADILQKYGQSLMRSKQWNPN